MQRQCAVQCLGRHIGIDPSVGIAGEIGDHATAVRTLVQPRDRYDRKHLVDCPHVWNRFKHGEIDEVFVHQALVEFIEHFAVAFFVAGQPRTHLMGDGVEKVVEFDIRTQGIGTLAGKLSGGNQQKVVLARELSRKLRLLVAAQPTRGLDVGSVEFVHTQIVAARDAGVPVLVVSTELDEVVALADRIVVMYRGGIVGIVPADTPRSVLGLMMAGEAAPANGKAA